jgi:hypothetical protein
VSLDLTPRPRLRMTRLLPLIAGATLWFSTAPAQVAHRDTGFLSEAALKELLYTVADDSMLGRTARAGGHDRAVLFLARELQRAGLEPAGENGSYFQTVPLVRRSLDTATTMAVSVTTLKLLDDFSPFLPQAGQPRSINGVQVVFGGRLGDSSSYISAAVAANKIVLLDAPTDLTRAGVFRGVTFPTGGRFGSAAAVALATLDSIPRHERLPFSSLRLDDGTSRNLADNPTSILVTQQAASKLLGRPLSGARPGDLGEIVRGRVVVIEQPQPVRNVVARLTGADPARAGQYVAIGAHSDAQGVGSPLNADSLRLVRRAHLFGIDAGVATPASQNAAALDSIYNGADDNGSGSVVVLAVAKALVAARPRPRRSVLFLWHAAEEAGLRGSSWFTAHPTVPLDSMIAYINLDMVGRGGEDDMPGGNPDLVRLLSVEPTDYGLANAIRRSNQGQGRPLAFDGTDPEQAICRSDQLPFMRAGIPVAMLTTGSHADYHAVSDEAQYIDYGKLSRIAVLMRDCLVMLAREFERPAAVSGLRRQPCT